MICKNIKKYLHLSASFLNVNNGWIKIIINYSDTSSLCYDYDLDNTECRQVINNVVIPNYENSTFIEILCNFEEEVLSCFFSEKRKGCDLTHNLFINDSSSERLLISFNESVTQYENNLVLYDKYHSNGTYFICDDFGNSILSSILNLINGVLEDNNIKCSDVVFLFNENYNILLKILFNEFTKATFIITISEPLIDLEKSFYVSNTIIKNKVIDTYLTYLGLNNQCLDFDLSNYLKSSRVILTRHFSESVLVSKYLISDKIINNETYNFKHVVLKGLQLCIFITNDIDSEILIKLNFKNSVKFIQRGTSDYNTACYINANDLLQDELLSVNIISINENGIFESDTNKQLFKTICSYVEYIRDNHLFNVKITEKYLSLILKCKDDNSSIICIGNENYHTQFKLLVSSNSREFNIDNSIVISNELNILCELPVADLDFKFYNSKFIPERRIDFFNNQVFDLLKHDSGDFLVNVLGCKTNPKKIIINFPGFNILDNLKEFNNIYYNNLGLLVKENDFIIYSFLDLISNINLYSFAENSTEKFVEGVHTFIIQELKQFKLNQQDIMIVGMYEGCTTAIELSSKFSNNSLISLCPILDRLDCEENYFKFSDNDRYALYSLKKQIEQSKNIVTLIRNKDYVSNLTYSNYLAGNSNSKLIISNAMHNDILLENVYLVNNYINSFILENKTSRAKINNLDSFIILDNTLSFKLKIGDTSCKTYYLGLINVKGEVESIHKVKNSKKYVFTTKSISFNKGISSLILYEISLNSSVNESILYEMPPLSFINNYIYISKTEKIKMLKKRILKKLRKISK